MRKTVSVILVVCMVMTLLCGCLFQKSDEELIEARLNAFLKAYNAGDLEGALKCFDAKTRNMYQAAMNIGSGLIGITGFEISMSDLFGLGVGLMSEGDILKLSDIEISIWNDTEATVRAVLSYQDSSERYSDSVKFYMVKEDGDWFISE